MRFPTTRRSRRASRRVTAGLGDSINTPRWFQYLPFMYLDNSHGVSKCPADDLEDSDKDGKRGPYEELGTRKQVIYFSYAMNPNQPKKAEPIYPDTMEGKMAIEWISGSESG